MSNKYENVISKMSTPEFNLLTGYRNLDTFSYDALQKTLQEEKIRTFEYLLTAQQVGVSFARFDLKMEDFKPKILPGSRYTRFAASLPGEFIIADRRKVYRTSSFNGQVITVDDTINNPSVFSHTFMVFIDGKFYNSLKLLPNEDDTYLIIDTNKVFSNTMATEILNDLILDNAMVTVLFVPNCNFGIYQTNRYVLDKYRNALPLSRFSVINNLDTESNYITFVTDNSQLFSSVVVETEITNRMMRFVDKQTNFNDAIVHLNIFGFRDLLEYKNISGNSKFFSIDLQDMPIPPENILFFRNINGKKYFAHDIKAKLYYPNFYEIENNVFQEDLTAYIFYFKGNSISGYHTFKNHIKLFIDTMGITAEDYENGTIPAIVKGYMPENVVYTIKDFEQNGTIPLSYQIDKMKEFASTNMDALERYLDYQFASDAFYIDCSSFDMTTKLRLNNYSEVMYEYDKVTFNEPMYVFILQRYGKMVDRLYRFFIDGLFYYPDNVFKDDSLEYYYIPARLVKDNSIIEVEKFDISYEIPVDVTVDDTGKFTVATPNNVAVRRDNIIVIDKDGLIIAPINNIISVAQTTERGNKVDVPLIGFAEMYSDELTIDLGVENANRELRVIFNRPVQSNVYLVENDNDRAAAYFVTMTGFKRKGYIRMFINGRLLPSEAVYTDIYNESLTGAFIVMPLVPREIGDVVVVEHVPFNYAEVYGLDLIASEKGFVDLREFIKIPFSLKYFDVYLNGRRLTYDQIVNVTENVIFIKNVESLRNLRIMIKNRASEELFTVNMESIMYEIWDTIEEFRNKLFDSFDIITDREKDIIEHLIDIISVIWELFQLEMKNHDYNILNPDIPNIPEEYATKYHQLFTDGSAVMINPDGTQISLQADKYYNPDSEKMF